MSQPPTGPRKHNTHNRDRRTGRWINNTGPNQSGAFYHVNAATPMPFGQAPGGYINPAPNLYLGHAWIRRHTPGHVDNLNFPVLPPPTSQPDVPSQRVEPTWASQFGLEGLMPPLQDGQIWLTPRYPSLKPTNTGTNSEPSKNTFVTKNPYATEVDALFTSEAIQRNRFAGLTTAEAQLFAASHSTATEKEASRDQLHGWFQEAFGVEMLDTLPQSWMRILRAERWVPFLRKVDPNGPESDIWGWENERVAKAVRSSVVLADAILRVALKGRWLQSVLPDQKPKETTHTLKDGTTRNICYLNRRNSHSIVEKPHVSLLNRRQPSTAGFSAEDVAFGVHRIEDQSQQSLKEQLERVVRGGPETESKEDEAGEVEETGKKKEPEEPWSNFVVKENIEGWENEAIQGLDEIANDIIWTFYDSNCDPLKAEGGGGRGLFHVRPVERTNDLGNNEAVYIIALNTELFTPLLDNEASPMEKVLTIHMAAIVMLRGIMTAVSMWKCAKYNLSSLAFDQERIADLASSFEKDTFGGKLDFPFHHDQTSGQRNGRAMLITGSEWPNAGDWVRDHFPLSSSWMDRLRMMGTAEPYAIRTQWFSYPIPGAWSVNMLKSEFWDKDYKDGFTLMFPKHFKALTQRCSETWGSTHLESKTFPVQIPEFQAHSSLPEPSWGTTREKPDKPDDLLEDECWHIGDKLKARGVQWEEARGDKYPPALLAWELTPYSMPQSRWMVAQLKHWIHDQSPLSEYLAHEVLFRFWLNEKPSANAGPLAWFYIAVGHMFAACLPSSSESLWSGPHFAEDPGDSVLAALSGAVAGRGFEPDSVDRAFNKGMITPGFHLKIRYGGLDERKRHLRLARRMGEIYFFTRPHARVLRRAFMASLRNLEHQAKEETSAENWWICQFAFPPYSANLEGVNADHTANMDAMSSQPDVPIAETGVVIKPQAFHQFAATMAQVKKESQPLAFGRWNKHTKADESYMEIQGDDFMDRYWTIGEIADKLAQGKIWILEPVSDGRLMVVDLARAIDAEDMSLEDVASVVDKGPFGFYAKDGSLRHHFNAATWKLFDKVGYALQQVPESMVRSNNGMNGKPLWIQVGDDVFDISNFPWYEFGGEELATKLRKQVQNLTTTFLDEGGEIFDKYPVILERLMPYRCAKVASTPIVHMELPGQMTFLTREEVRWYEFPETGMYVIVDKKVYDVSEYCEIHPGGEQILRRYGGQDVTEIFHKSHSNPYELLKTPVCEAMLVGRIIPTRSYDEPCLVTEEERAGYIWSKRPEDKHPNGDPLCVAKRLKKAGPLVRMRHKELELCDGDDTEEWFNEGWVAVGDLVYNMTSVARYNKEPWVEFLKGSLGERVEDEEIAKHIQKNYRFRAVALLENEDTEDDYVLGKRKRDASPRQYAQRLQRRDRVLFNDPPADLYLNDANEPQTNIPQPDTLALKYPFKPPKRRHPPAPYNDYTTPFDKDHFLEQATGQYYRLVRDEAKRRKGEEIDRRDEEGRRVHWSDWGRHLIEGEERAAGVQPGAWEDVGYFDLSLYDTEDE